MMLTRLGFWNQKNNHIDTHEGYAVPPVRGAFWKELAQVGLGRMDELSVLARGASPLA